MSRLAVSLLGPFIATLDGQSLLPFRSNKVQALLAYLITEEAFSPGVSHQREGLMALLWPDYDLNSARTNLRQTLYRLRGAIPAVAAREDNEPTSLVLAEGQSLRINPHAAYEFDTASFLERLQANPTPAQLKEAVALYRGDFLADFYLPDSSEYEEWVSTRRETLRRQAMTALETLTSTTIHQGNYDEAAAYARRQLVIDDLHESAHRQLIESLARSGQRAGALRAYHHCEELLQKELGIAPGQAMQQLYERLIKRKAQPSFAVSITASRQPLARARTPLVGRDAQWQLLQSEWQAARSGIASFVLISGEAGIGKSRLAEEMLDWLARSDVARARSRAYAAEGALAYGPIVEWLQTPLLAERLRLLDEVWLIELSRLLPELRAERPELPPPSPLTESWQQRRLFEALAQVAITGDPLLLVLDDLQWCDRETLEWLRFLFHYAPQTPLLLIGTVRSEEVEPEHPLQALRLSLRRAGQLTEMELGPLVADETAALAEAVAGEALETAQLDRVHRESEGYPLFVVELVRAGLDRLAEPESPGAGAMPVMVALPPRIQAVIQTRLAQLSAPARSLAGLAATIGREFSFELLLAAGEGEESTLIEALDELWRRRIIRERGADAYDFSHDKIRDVVYAELSPIRRNRLHRQIAASLEQLHRANLDAASGLVATHYERAGVIGLAVDYYQRAGEAAQKVFAQTDAVQFLQRGLRLLGRLPSSRDRMERELAMLTELGVSLVALGGYAFHETHETYSRIISLCRRLGREPSGPALRGLAISSLVRGELAQAYDYGRQLLELAQHSEDNIMYVEANYALGVIRFWQGEFIHSRSHLEEGLASYKPEQLKTHLGLYSQDPQVVCLSRLAVTEWFLGEEDEAVQTMERAVAMATEMEHPFSLAYVLTFAANLYHFRQDPSAAYDKAIQAINVSRQHQTPYWLGYAQWIRGWALAQKGEIEEGISAMVAGRDTIRATGAELQIQYMNAFIAAIEARIGKIEEELKHLKEAFASMDRRGELWCASELFRLQGELLQMAGADSKEVEAAFRRSLAYAQKQEAKALALRSSLALARFLEQQGRHAEARAALLSAVEVMDGLAETAELSKAKGLLEGLA